MNRTNAVKGFVGVLLACCVGLQPAEAASKKLKVFILAGQSNMEGQGVVSMDGERDYNGGKGNLVWSMKNSKSAEKMKCLKNEKGEWVVRDDVQISFKVGDKVRKGGLTVGYTGYGGSSHIGPELGFGFVMGDYFKEPVLLVKTAWGGKSLYVDFRPPSSGGQVGPCYTKMVEEVRAALVELGDQKYEIAGFVWQQGWNDMCTKPAIPEYAQNLVNLVKDLRKEFNVPNMPVVVGELGNGGPVTSGDMFDFRKAQEEGTKQIKNAVFIKTTDFARPAELSPNPGHGHHWYGNAESYFLIGDAAGEGMKSLLQLSSGALPAAEFHVAITGSDASPGTQAAPLRTIQRAAELAQPGDTVTVHAGVYRECVNPPRGGESDTKRIVYQAASGEQVVITGSEAVKKWEKVQDGVWKATLPNSFFGGFNPFAEVIGGDWFHARNRSHHAGAVYLNGHWLTEAVSLEEVLKPMTATPLWFASVDPTHTVIWAQFKDFDPNAQQVEVNVRRFVFYPDKPGRNYITVRGFTLRNAATPWAPPTVEQIGLIGVHWSKGWIIENNDIAYSTCSGITLGKYGDAKDHNTGSATGYVTTIERGLQNGWNKETVGHHVVRNNHIAHCEQAGIVGSLGAVFSTVSGNSIHDIHVRQLFSGAEMAGIKFHGPIDATISGNHIYRTCRGIWLDWMTQGTRISNNLCHDNATHDLFVEVNHGPFVVDNNIFLTPKAIEDDSQGGAYVHNLIAGGIDLNPTFYDGRKTPFHKAHSTEVVALHDNPSGDNHYYNNLFMRSGSLEKYDQAHLPMWMDGNVFFQGTKSSKHESAPINRSASDPGLTLVEKNDGFYLTMTLATALGSERPSKPVTSARLGKASISGCAFENPDGSPITIGTDYFGKPRNTVNPTSGPFEAPWTGMLTMKVWPLASAQETNSNIPTSSLVR